MDLHREIEFRGLDRIEKKWRFGCLLVIDGNPHIIESSDISEVGHHFQQEGDRPTWVIPETVGQFTGLTDRKGTKIYEGDIVKRQMRDFLNIKKHNEYIYGVVYYDDEVGAFGIRTFPLHTLEIFNEIGTEDIEVIANIHDNHELTEWEFKETGKNSGSYVPPQKLLEL